MRGLWFLLLLVLAHACLADMTYLGEVSVKDTAKWGELYRPNAVWPMGNLLYVADSGNNRIVVFENNETKSIMSAGGGSSSDLLFPRALFFADDGKMYVANTGQNKINIYKGGVLQYSIGESQGSSYAFEQPSGVVVYGGYVYVSDSGNGKVKYFSQKDRTYQGYIGESGFGEGQLSEARALAVHEGVIYVADRGNNKIQMFGLDGGALGSIRGAYECGLSGPHGVAVNDKGLVFVADTWNGRIVVFERYGNCIETLRGTPLKNFSEPVGIYVTANNVVYITDTESEAVYLFKYTPEDESPVGAEDRISEAEGLLASLGPLFSAAEHLGIAHSDTASPFIETAKTEFSGGRYSNAYHNASLAVSETNAMKSKLSSKVHSEVLSIAVGDENTLASIDEQAAGYGVHVETGPLKSKIKEVRDMLDSGDYVNAAFNITSVHSEVREFKGEFLDSSKDNIGIRDGLWLNISEVRNRVANITRAAAQYNLSIDYSEANSNLDAAYEFCGLFRFEDCRAYMSKAEAKLDEFESAIGEHSAKVQEAEEKIKLAYDELADAQAEAYFVKPDLGPAERRLSEAESVLVEDPERAMGLVDDALEFVESSKAGINRTNQLAFIGVGVLLLIGIAAVGAYYATRRKRRGRKEKPAKP